MLCAEWLAELVTTYRAGSTNASVKGQAQQSGSKRKTGQLISTQIWIIIVDFHCERKCYNCTVDCQSAALDIQWMEISAHFYFAESLAPSTQCSYQSVQQRYRKFCSETGHAPTPVGAAELDQSRYCAWLEFLQFLCHVCCPVVLSCVARSIL